MIESQTNRDRSAKVWWMLGFTACAFNIFSVLAINYWWYVIYVYIGHHEDDPWDVFDYFAAVNDLVWLAPVAVILLARCNRYIVAIYLSVMTVIFIRTIYLLMPDTWTGINVLFIKFDWSTLLLTAVGAVSSVVVPILVVWRLIAFIAGRRSEHPAAGALTASDTESTTRH